jgi:hypothetical protein
VRDCELIPFALDFSQEPMYLINVGDIEERVVDSTKTPFLRDGIGDKLTYICYYVTMLPVEEA